MGEVKKVKLGINIHCGDIKVPSGFEFQIVHDNYFSFIDRYLEMCDILSEVYGKEHVDKFVGILRDWFSHGNYKRYYNILPINESSSGTLWWNYELELINKKLISGKEFKEYGWEGEILQAMDYVYEKTDDKWNVVDFNDCSLGTCKTYKEASNIFKLQYPYMESGLVGNFIYEIGNKK